MEIKVYVDTLFFTNLFMDYALLYICSKVLKIKINLPKMLIASLFGATYGIFSFFTSLPCLLFGISKLLSGSIMVFTAFTPKKIGTFIKYTCIFFAITFCAGGIIYSLIYYTSMGSELQAVVSGGILYINIPVYKFIIAFGSCYFILTVFSTTSKRFRKLSDIIYNVTITLNDKNVVFKAIIDSGNSLKEPCSNLDVIIAEKKVLTPLFEDEDYKTFLTREKKYKMAYIPCKSITGKEEIIGFIPDAIKINNKEVDAFIGITEIRLSDDFSALIPYNIHERIE